VISAARQFSGTPDLLPPSSTMSDYGEHHHIQTGSRNSTPNRKYTNNLAKETDIDAISMAIPNSFWGTFFTGIYADLIWRLLYAEVQDGGWIPEVVIIWRRIRRALKHCRSRWDYLDIVFRRKVITTVYFRYLSAILEFLGKGSVGWCWHIHQ